MEQINFLLTEKCDVSWLTGESLQKKDLVITKLPLSAEHLKPEITEKYQTYFYQLLIVKAENVKTKQVLRILQAQVKGDKKGTRVKAIGSVEKWLNRVFPDSFLPTSATLEYLTSLIA